MCPLGFPAGEPVPLITTENLSKKFHNKSTAIQWHFGTGLYDRTEEALINTLSLSLPLSLSFSLSRRLCLSRCCVCVFNTQRAVGNSHNLMRAPCASPFNGVCVCVANQEPQHKRSHCQGPLLTLAACSVLKHTNKHMHAYTHTHTRRNIHSQEHTHTMM